MKLKHYLFAMFHPRTWIRFFRLLIHSIPHIIEQMFFFLIFFIVLLYYVFRKILGKFFRLLKKVPVVGHISETFLQVWNRVAKNKIERLINRMEHIGTSVNRSYIIELAIKNLVSRRTRTFITIAGMSVGIGIIVLLLSFGYGIERLIIGRIASLEELRMFDITAGGNTALNLDNELIKKLSQIQNIEKTVPLIATVGKLNYKNATTDVLVYAAPQSYLHLSKLKLLKGKLFSNTMEYQRIYGMMQKDSQGQVAGVTTKLIEGNYNALVSSKTTYFNVYPDKVVSVWQECEIKPRLLGYTVRYEGGYSGREYWGGIYSPFSPYGRVAVDSTTNTELGKWIKAKVPLFEKTADDRLVPKLDKYGRHVWENGCLEMTHIQVTDELSFAEVLGESTASASLASGSEEATQSAVFAYEDTVVASSSSGLEFVVLEASAAADVKKSSSSLVFNGSPDGEAVVSSGLLNLLNIPLSSAVGTKLKVQFIITRSLLPTVDGRSLSPEVEYVITGVVEDDDTTSFYIPYSDLAKLGVVHFSQVKVVMKDTNSLAQARKRVDVLGLRTSSTTDTVKEIESLFSNLRIILGILGMVALVVASLGMFNTLTVSLLERTREIGGMKTMGVVSEEVQDLFLSEAIIMGLAGGLGGLLIGFIAGKFISLIVSIFAIAGGQGYLDLTYIPFSFTVFIMVSSFAVGVLTGLYPARRAKKISALNALRYE